MRINFIGILLMVLFFDNSVSAQWLNIGPGGEALSSVSFRNANDGWVCGANGTLLRTTDGGATWQRLTDFPVPTNPTRSRVLSVATPFQYDVAILVQQPSALEPSAAYFSSRNGYGFEVNNVGYADYTFMSAHTTSLFMLVGGGGALDMSLGQGRSWILLPSGTENDLFGADSPDGKTYYLVGSKGTLRKGRYEPPYSSPRALNSTTLNRLSSVWFVDTEQGYIVGEHGTALRTTDGGTTWLPMPINTTANLNSVRFLSATTGFIVGDLGTLLLTIDGGRSWRTEASNTFESLTGIYATPDGLNTWVVGDNGTVLKRSAVMPLASHSSTAIPTWQVYPNPFTTSLTLALPPAATLREARLLDPLGRLVVRRMISPSTLPASYPLSLPGSLPPGVYSLRLVTAGQSPKIQRLVRLP